MKQLRFLLSLSAIFLISCSKIDYGSEKIRNAQVESKFFDLTNAKPAVKRAANSLKKHSNFINTLESFVAKHGYPRWDKVMFTGKSKSQFAARDNFTIGTEEELTSGVFFTPFVDEENMVVSTYIVIYQHNPDLFSYRIYNREDIIAIEPELETSQYTDFKIAFSLFAFFEQSIHNRDSTEFQGRDGNTTVKPREVSFSTIDLSGFFCYEEFGIQIVFSWENMEFEYDPYINTYCSDSPVPTGSGGGGSEPPGYEPNPYGIPPGGGSYSPTWPNFPGGGGVGGVGGTGAPNGTSTFSPSGPVYHNPFEDPEDPMYNPGFYSDFYPWWNPYIPFDDIEEIPANLRSLRNVLSLTETQVSWFMDPNHDREKFVQPILDYLAEDENETPEGHERCLQHINSMMDNSEYLDFVVDHYEEGDNEKVWWEDENWFDDTNNFGLDPYDPLRKLTAAEKILIDKYPIQSGFIGLNRSTAISWSHTIFVLQPQLNGLNDKKDAFRHAFFNAINTRDVPGAAGLTSPQIVEVFGIAHESGVPPQLQLEKEMDLENNQDGINYCYTGCDDQTDSQIALAIKGMVDVGYMTYLTPTLTDLQDVNFWGLNWGITGIEDPQTATHGLILACPPPYNCALTTKKPTNQ